MRDLSEIRVDIDKIDTELIELFKKRMNCAKEVGLYKKANNIPVLNQQRENEIHETALWAVSGYGLPICQLHGQDV